MDFLTLSTPDKIFSNNILKYFSYFPKKTGFDISCKLETICIKHQILFSSNNKKISIYRLLNLPIDW